MLIPKNIQESDFTADVEYLTARSSGAGGQNVNKVETKVFLRFNIDKSEQFTNNEKTLLKTKLSSYIIDDSIIQVMCQESRSQLKNKELAFKKFILILKNAFVINKKREITGPTLESVVKRLESKRRNSEVKANRSKIKW